MALQLPIHYDQFLELLGQLSDEQQDDLIKHLIAHRAQQRRLTVDEKLQLLDSIKLDVAVNEAPSIRRVDWYNDDGR